jgi:hypothetical protein|tara:strand:- start:122 stop:451 length:330 start_codon:yes stop_codon:yes gene_type:complete
MEMLMGFKMKMGKLSIDNTPIYQIDEEEGVMGRANKNGSITLNKNLSPLEQEDVIKHEKVHLDQMERGDLDYDDKNVYWKGKKMPRSKMEEGGKNLPWEKEAYKANRIK